MDLQLFLSEKKRLVIIFFTIIIVVFVLSIIVIIVRHQKKQSNNLSDRKVTISPTKSQQTNEEIIQSLGYSIDCQLVVTTSAKKLFVKKFDRCVNALDYKLSPSKKYAAFLRADKNNISQVFIYSLDNNVEARLQIISQPLVQYQFDAKNNLALLLSDKFIYYFIPLLLSGYPSNYYKELETFTDVDKKRIEVPLPETKTPYAKILEQERGISLTDTAGVILYTIGFSDLEESLSPTFPTTVDRRLLNWDKRIFFFLGQEFKTMDMDGSNELTHRFICDGIEVIPIEFRNNLMARSPDGQTLAFLTPTEAQMRENPNWKNEILDGKKIFDRGELALYDFVKSDCQKTGVVQSLQFRETFSFSPNGQYIVFVDKGVSLYNLRDKQDYQLVIHNPERENDNTAVTGPLVWDGTSKFIFTLVSKTDNRVISSTKLVRIYFDEKFNGVEQILFTTANDTLYTVSSDGSKILYTKDKQIFKYDVDRELNSLFSTSSVDKINKLVWLRNGTIVSNLWYANENLYFSKFPEISAFQIDFDGETVVYATQSAKTIFLYNLVFKRQQFFKDKRIIEGNILRLFY